jgi:uncharacterized Tic20 family protein
MSTSLHSPQLSVDHRPLVGAEARQWAMAAHVGSFVAAWVALGVLCPIIVALARGHDRFVRHHAYESLNFQVNALLWIVLSVVLMPVLIGFVLIACVGLWYLAFVLRAGLAANRGEWYRYPLIFRLFRP